MARNRPGSGNSFAMSRDDHFSGILRRYFMVIVVKNAFLTFQFFVALKILVFFRSSLIVLKGNEAS